MRYTQSTEWGLSTAVDFTLNQGGEEGHRGENLP